MRRYSNRTALTTLAEINITPLLDLALVERNGFGELVFDARLGRRGAVGQAPDAQDRDRVVILRRTDQVRRPGADQARP